MPFISLPSSGGTGVAPVMIDNTANPVGTRIVSKLNTTSTPNQIELSYGLDGDDENSLVPWLTLPLPLLALFIAALAVVFGPMVSAIGQNSTNFQYTVFTNGLESSNYQGDGSSLPVPYDAVNYDEGDESLLGHFTGIDAETHSPVLYQDDSRVDILGTHTIAEHQNIFDNIAASGSSDAYVSFVKFTSDSVLSYAHTYNGYVANGSEIGFFMYDLGVAAFVVEEDAEAAFDGTPLYESTGNHFTTDTTVTGGSVPVFALNGLEVFASHIYAVVFVLNPDTPGAHSHARVYTSYSWFDTAEITVAKRVSDTYTCYFTPTSWDGFHSVGTWTTGTGTAPIEFSYAAVATIEKPVTTLDLAASMDASYNDGNDTLTIGASPRALLSGNGDGSAVTNDTGFFTFYAVSGGWTYFEIFGQLKTDQTMVQFQFFPHAAARTYDAYLYNGDGTMLLGQVNNVVNTGGADSWVEFNWPVAVDFSAGEKFVIVLFMQGAALTSMNMGGINWDADFTEMEIWGFDRGDGLKPFPHLPTNIPGSGMPTVRIVWGDLGYYPTSVLASGPGISIDSNGSGTSTISLPAALELPGTLLLTDTVWEDIRVTPGAYSFAGVTDPTLVDYQPTAAGASFLLYEFAVDDEAFMEVQLPHGYKAGTDIKPHLHWTPGPNGVAESGNAVGWKMDYSISGINETFPVSAQLDLSDPCDGTDDKHQLAGGAAIPGTGLAESDVLLIRLFRSDTGTDDTWGGSGTGNLPMVVSVDVHVELEKLGSDNEIP